MNRTMVPVFTILGVVALIGAFASYMDEKQNARYEANYAFALFCLAAGAFLILLAVITANGRRHDV